MNIWAYLHKSVESIPTDAIHFYGWNIFKIRVNTIANPVEGQSYECVDNWVARHSVSGVTMNTNTLEGIKVMVHQKNKLIRQTTI